jgi:hypothetical protein
VPEALARTDHDFTIRQDNGKHRRRKSAEAEPSRWSRLAPLWRYPGRSVGLMVGSALIAGFVVNALILQGGPHPAPLFAPTPRLAQTVPQTVPKVLPPERPAQIAAAPELARPGPAPAPKLDKQTVLTMPAPAAPRDAIGDVLRTGAVGEPSKQVVAAQKALQKLGYGPIKADGVFGSGTKQAIERFERDRKLPLTGELAGRTAKELLAAAAAIPE